ncbi:MAG: PH domain-containing protein [Nitrospirae bacterium]|nr:MAG: PH domain-containing protein [Nitrospirota bacterium]
MTEPPSSDETIRWNTYPSWGQFVWLYFMSLLTASRGLLLLKFEIPGWSLWLGGAVALLACAAALRRWAKYSITASRVVVTNGYTGRVIETVTIPHIEELTIRQGPMAQWLGIGTLVIRTAGGGQIRLRGINDPEVVRNRLEAMRPAGAAPAD